MQQHDNDQDKSKNTWQTFKGRILSKKSNKHKFAVKFVQKKTHFLFILFPCYRFIKCTRPNI